MFSGWCCSDDEEKNRTPSQDGQSDTDTSHVGEHAEDEFHESDEDHERDEVGHLAYTGPRVSRHVSGHLSNRSSGTEFAPAPAAQSNYIPSSEDFSTVKGNSLFFNYDHVKVIYLPKA